jgi:hypothetical protein
VYVKVNGAVPVNSNVIVGRGLPTQIVAEPVTLDTVGSGFSEITTGVPRLVALQVFASVNAVNEYVPRAGFARVKVVVG